MTLAHFESEHFFGKLISIITPARERHYFQNFRPGESFEFRNNDYIFLPFDVPSTSESLEIDSFSASIRLASTQFIRNLLFQEVDLRKSIVKIYTVFPNNIGAEYKEETTQISSYSQVEGVIEISCLSPLSAVDGEIPSKRFDPSSFPHLPLINNPNLNAR